MAEENKCCMHKENAYELEQPLQSCPPGFFQQFPTSPPLTFVMLLTNWSTGHWALGGNGDGRGVRTLKKRAARLPKVAPANANKPFCIAPTPRGPATSAECAAKGAADAVCKGAPVMLYLTMSIRKKEIKIPEQRMEVRPQMNMRQDYVCTTNHVHSFISSVHKQLQRANKSFCESFHISSKN